ncbi:MAG: IS1634 family transposase, partial [Lentisphaerae bacterium]|nr:IS1634 family transposase [Lentisphaerota bacterium]
ENGKVRHRTIANISACSEDEIECIRLALKHKHDLAALTSVSKDISLVQGLSIGAVWVIWDIAKQIGIADALGPSREGRLALWQVIARIIDQGSRLSAVRLATSHSACDVLGLDDFNEEHLYRNLDWLSDKQEQIENRLFHNSQTETPPELFLYDVTSSYFEGTQNELAAFGYNRDKKKGKKQVVIGLLCSENGRPLSIEVFPGNSQDPKTLASQIRKTSERFGGKDVTFVGDRGMIKSKQIENLLENGFHYITAITKPQIESLIKKNVIQMSLFDQDLAEIAVDDETIRHILRRNPIRAVEIQCSREDRLLSVRREVGKKNEYLKEHSRAKTDVALRHIKGRIAKLKVSKWLSPSVSDRKILLTIDEDALGEESKLDGCYVLKTDLEKEKIGKNEIHSRYKDLALVEWAFRTSKTVELEMRPIHVRLASRTRGHALVVMLAYLIVRELAERWKDIETTVGEGVRELTMLCTTEIHVKGKPGCNKIPLPRSSIRDLLTEAKVRLPEVLPIRDARVATKKKLTESRKKSKNQ